MTVQTDAGERELSKAEADGMRCDAPGCGRTRFLEVHHIKPRNRGGSNKADNLVTLCSTCHRLWHERGSGSVVEVRESAPKYSGCPRALRVVPNRGKR